MSTALPQKFHPTAAQSRFLDRAIDSPWLANTDAYCQAAGCDRSSYYRWMRDPAFRHWFFSAWTAVLIQDAWQMLNRARTRADKDHQAFRVLFRLVFERSGQQVLSRFLNLVEEIQVETVVPFPEQNQADSPENATNSAPAPQPPPPPAPAPHPPISPTLAAAKEILAVIKENAALLKRLPS
jgi:hypothetical protein